MLWRQSKELLSYMMILGVRLVVRETRVVTARA